MQDFCPSKVVQWILLKCHCATVEEPFNMFNCIRKYVSKCMWCCLRDNLILHLWCGGHAWNYCKAVLVTLTCNMSMSSMRLVSSLGAFFINRFYWPRSSWTTKTISFANPKCTWQIPTCRNPAVNQENLAKDFGIQRFFRFPLTPLMARAGDLVAICWTDICWRFIPLYGYRCRAREGMDEFIVSSRKAI